MKTPLEVEAIHDKMSEKLIEQYEKDYREEYPDWEAPASKRTAKLDDAELRLNQALREIAERPRITSQSIKSYDGEAFKRHEEYLLLVNMLTLAGWQIDIVAYWLGTREASLRVRMSRLGLRKGMLEELPQPCEFAERTADTMKRRASMREGLGMGY